MKIENAVSDFKQSKKLKELGVTQKSFNGWIKVTNKENRKAEYYTYLKDKCVAEIIQAQIEKDGTKSSIEYYSSFGVAELGVMLPNEIDDGTGNYFFTKGGLLHTYQSVNGKVLMEWQGTELEAIRRAEMLIDLLESKLITVEDVNRRLQQN